MSSLSFTKMHGLGNDFVVVDGITEPKKFSPAQIKTLANRHTGIGFDQLLLIEKNTDADFACRIFNADASEAEQCGNGLRCVARFLYDTALAKQTHFSIATKAGVFHAEILPNDLIAVSMGSPSFQPEHVPFITETKKNKYALQLSSEPVELSVLSMGNPHAVLEVDSIDSFPVKDIGSQVASHPAFPSSTNVGFMEIINRQQIRLRTFERGVGETFACGSNACAAVVAGIQNGALDNQVTVKLTQGELIIEWLSRDTAVKMIGPAVKIFDGVIEI